MMQTVIVFSKQVTLDKDFVYTLLFHARHFSFFFSKWRNLRKLDKPAIFPRSTLKRKADQIAEIIRYLLIYCKADQTAKILRYLLIHIEK